MTDPLRGNEIPAGKVVVIRAWEEPDGWSAKSVGWPAIEVTGGASRPEAINEVRGACLCAIGQMATVPRSVTFQEDESA